MISISRTRIFCIFIIVVFVLTIVSIVLATEICAIERASLLHMDIYQIHSSSAPIYQYI